MADLKAKIIINAQDNASAAFKSLESSVSAVKDRINQFMGLQLTSYFSGMVSSLKDAAESYQTLNARLKLVITDTDEYSKAQKELFDIAQRSRGNLEGTIGLYTSIDEKIKEMGGSSKETAAVVETVNKAIALTSQGVQGDSAALLQFKQAINSATLAGDELKSILENSPGLARTMAEGLGVPVGALKKLGAEGKLTSTEVVNAIIKMQGAVDEKFSAIPMTIGQAMTRVNNAWTQYIGKANEASGATSRVAGVIATAGDNIPQLVSSVATLAEIYGVKLVGDLVKFTAATVQSNAAKNAAQAATQKVVAAEQELVAAMANGGTQTTRYQAAQEQLNVALSQGGTATAGLASRYSELQAVQAKSDAANQRLVTAQNELNAALTAGGVEVARYAAAQAAVNAEKLNAQQATARLATAEADLNAAIAQGSAGSVRATMMQTEVNAVRVTAQQAATRLAAAETELNAAMTAGGAATQRYAAAYSQVNVAQTQAATAATTLAARTEALTISTNTATTAAERLGGAFNSAMSIFAGWSIGTMTGEWLNNFEMVRQGGAYMSEAFVKSAETARYFFSGEFLTADSGTFAAKMAEIGKSFDEIRAKTTDAAQATENASKTQAEVLKAQVLATQEAFKAQVDKLTETSKAIDERYKSENNLIKQTTEFKIAQIKSLFMTESEEAEAITKLKTESNQKEVDNLTKAAEEKKKLLDQVYQTEISKLAEGNVQRKQYEKDYLDASQKIYQDLFDSYDGTIKAMTSAAQAHRDKALGFAKDILEAEQRKHDGILELERIGMNDAQLKASKKKEIADDIAKYKKLMADGEYEQALVLSKKTEQLVLDLAKTEKTQSSDVRSAKEQYKKVIDQTEEATRKLQQSEENQANKLEENAKSQVEKMEGVKGKIGEIQEKLDKEHLLKITADSSQAEQKVSELKQPTESQHTIKSDASAPKNDISEIVKPTSSTHTIYVTTIQQNQNGGMIQHFQSGGMPNFQRREGKLSGYGGGDTVPAMLEPGEFIMRKEAVQKYGAGFMYQLNQAQIDSLPHFSTGGFFKGIGDKKEDMQKNGTSEKDIKDFNGFLNVFNGAYYDSASRGSTYSAWAKRTNQEWLLDSLLEWARSAKREQDFKPVLDRIDLEKRRNNVAIEKLIYESTDSITPTHIQAAKSNALDIQHFATGGIVDREPAGLLEKEKFQKVLSWISNPNFSDAENHYKAEREFYKNDKDKLQEIDRFYNGATLSINGEQKYQTGVLQNESIEKLVVQNLKRDPKISEIRARYEAEKEVFKNSPAKLKEIEDRYNGRTSFLQNGERTYQAGLLDAEGIEKWTAHFLDNGNLSENQARYFAEKKFYEKNPTKLKEIENRYNGGTAYLKNGEQIYQAGILELDAVQNLIKENKGFFKNLSETEISYLAEKEIFKNKPAKLREIDLRYNSKKTKAFATGGQLDGYGGGDTVPAMLEPGEFIVKKEAVKEIGTHALEQINQGNLPIQKFSAGGQVGSEQITQSVSNQIITIRFELPSGKTAQGTFSKTDATNVVEILKQAAASGMPAIF